MFFYCFILSNIWTNSAPSRDIRLRNLSGLDFDLSRSLRVKHDSVIGRSIYSFILVYTSKNMSISLRLAVIATQNIFSISYH